MQQDNKKAAEKIRQPEYKDTTHEDLQKKYWWITIPPSLISIVISLYMILKILKVL